MYGKAVDLYRTFIATYAESDYIYEFSFLEGEALYWSERYPEAIAQYKWVRDHRDLGTRYYIDAARSVVQSYEAEAQREVAAGKLQPLKVPTVAELKALPPPLAAAADPADLPRAPGRVRQLPEHRRRSQGRAAAGHQRRADQPGVPPHRRRDRAVRQGDGQVLRLGRGRRPPRTASWRSTRRQANFDAIEATNKRFISAKCGDEKAIAARDVAEPLAQLLARRRAATRRASTPPAAEAFYRFYKTAADNDPDLPVALYNAAVAYKLADRPKTAIALFKEFTENPAKAFTRQPVLPRRDAAARRRATRPRSTTTTRSRPTSTLYDTTKQGQAARHQAARAAARREAADARPDRPRRDVQRRVRRPSSAATSRRRSSSTPSTARSSPIAARRTARCGRSPGIYRQQGDINHDDRDARPLARALRQGPRQRGRLRRVVLRHRRGRQEEGPDRRGQGRRRGDDRRLEGARLDQEQPRAPGSPASGSSSSPRTATPRAGSPTSSRPPRARWPRPSRAGRPARQAQDRRRGQVPRARSVRRGRVHDGGQGPVRRHPVRRRAEDRRRADPGAGRPQQQRGGGRGLRDPARRQPQEEARRGQAAVGRGLRPGQEGRGLQQVEPQGAGEPRPRVPGRVHARCARRSCRGRTRHDDLAS